MINELLTGFTFSQFCYTVESRFLEPSISQKPQSDSNQNLFSWDLFHCDRTLCRPIQSVIILVIKQIGLQLHAHPILFMTYIITD